MAKQDEKDADFVLSDSTKINFDLSKLSYRQWKGMFDPKESDEESDETLARVSGISPEDLGGLPFLEYRRLLAAFYKRCREPLSDPNA